MIFCKLLTNFASFKTRLQTPRLLSAPSTLVCGIRPFSIIAAGGRRDTLTVSGALRCPATVTEVRRLFSTEELAPTPLAAHYEHTGSLENFWRKMALIYLNAIPDDIKPAFQSEYEKLDFKAGHQTDLLRAFFNNVLKTLVRKSFGCPELVVNNLLLTKEDVTDLEALAGFSNRYSSVAAFVTAKLVPNIAKSYFPSAKPSIIEIGGYCQNDAFLFHHLWFKENFIPFEYKAIEVFRSGIIAGQCFNTHVAQIANLEFINKPANLALHDLIPTHREKPKIIIALRFLSAVDPKTIPDFFKILGGLLKPGDIFIFNYTLFNEEAERVGRQNGYRLLVKSGLITLEKKVEGKWILYQNFFTSSFIDALIKNNHLQTIESIPDSQLVRKTQIGNESCRTKWDSYERTLVLAEAPGF